MQRKRFVLYWSVALGLALALTWAAAAQGTQSSIDSPTRPFGKAEAVTWSRPDTRVILRLDTSGTRTRARIAPPARSASFRPAGTSIVVNYLAAGEFNGYDTCAAWPTDAKAAFEYATSIWAGLINSAVPITIDACWYYETSATLGYNFLGDGSHDFVGAPVAGTWYAPALANALHGSDLMPGEADTNIAINSNFGWYTGTDGNPGASEVDMVSVVLHEIAHGLGFSGSMWVDTAGYTLYCGGLGQGCWGTEGYPDIYDRFTENAAGQFLISAYANPSAALGSALTSNNLWFDGTYAKAANGGQKVKIYAPSPWSPGSSYAHLDYNTFKDTEHQLMVYQLNSGSAIHHPGTITLGILRDIGWYSAPSAPDVQIVKQLVGPAEPKPGDRITFTLAISNVGSLPATSVVVTDVIPSQVLTPTYASTLNITRTGVVSYVWNVGALAVGQGGVITIYGRIDPSLPSELGFTNVAFISDPQDSVTSNNASSARVGGYKVNLPLVLKDYPPIRSHTYYASTDDTTLRTNGADTWFGNYTDFVVGYCTISPYNIGTARAVMRFNLDSIPAGAYIKSATLQPYLVSSVWQSGQSNNMVVTAYRINRAWPSQPTWNNFSGAFVESYGATTIGTSFAYYDIDVKALVQGWVNGTWSNYGIMLRGQEGSYCNLKGFGSADGSSHWPQLVVEYPDPTLAGSMTTVVVPAEPLGDAPASSMLPSWSPTADEGLEYSYIK